MSGKAWKGVAVTGIVLTTMGASAGYIELASLEFATIDFATQFHLETIFEHFGFFMLSLLFGTAVASIGLVGWARHLERPSRVRMAGWVFAFPWILFLLGYPIAGFNVHGPGPLVLLLVVPASILAIVLLLIRKSKSLPAN